MLIKCSHKLLNSPPVIQPGLEPGRFLAVMFTSDCGWREEGGDREVGGGADVLGIKLCHLLLHPSAEKSNASVHPPEPLPYPKCPPRRGGAMLQLISGGQRSLRNPQHDLFRA